MRRLSSDLSRRGANGAAAEELRSHLDREGFLPPKLLRDAIFAD
jgi:hypothetical protein